ncbi:hypothetical protein GCM10009678_14530 [Actinomadura kijaniata]|uniref:Mur ligase C-terminal domain-containing protein n=1 Tax=Actinomadura namibiensis TaxID=182080 RepID=A0A7W3LQV2_ACTNM|nr:cyanophycin synthetase [Actinomadura namibiensis]MBA8952623.1 hypothetical protein [Actinomadura namibiensis]
MRTRTHVVVSTFGRARFTLTTPLGSAPIAPQVLGEHQVSSTWAAAAAIVEALSNAQPLSSGRLEVLERADGVVIINDAFNANVDSMTAGLHTLTAMATGRLPRHRHELLKPGVTACLKASHALHLDELATRLANDHPRRLRRQGLDR